MRRRITLTVLAAAFVAIVAFAVPLGIGVGRLYHDEAVLRLEREAERAVAAVPESFQASGDPVELPQPPDGIATAVYDLTGRRLLGTGPAAGGTLVAAAARGRVVDGDDGDQLAVAAPVFDEEQVVAVVRAAEPAHTATDDANEARLLMAGLAIVVVGVAGLVGLLVARRLARPVEMLTAAATRLGEGDFTAGGDRSGVREIDEAATALDRTARRLGTTLERERRFSADASHQLRTPLTRLRLALESIGVDDTADSEALVAEALRHADRLEATIEELLALARDADADPHHRTADLPALLAEVEAQWHGPFAARGRRLEVAAHDVADVAVAVTPAALRHTLDVLVSNAFEHGEGQVGVTAASTVGGAVTVDVSDEGPGFTDPEAAFARRSPDATGHGFGLALARSLVEAAGGRLLVTQAAPAPTIRVILPAAPPGRSGRAS